MGPHWWLRWYESPLLRPLNGTQIQKARAVQELPRVTCTKPLIHIVKTIHLLVSSSLQLQLQWGSVYGSIMALKLWKIQWLLRTKKPNAVHNEISHRSNNRRVEKTAYPDRLLLGLNNRAHIYKHLKEEQVEQLTKHTAPQSGEFASADIKCRLGLVPETFTSEADVNELELK